MFPPRQGLLPEWQPSALCTTNIQRSGLPSVRFQVWLLSLKVCQSIVFFTKSHNQHFHFPGTVRLHSLRITMLVTELSPAWPSVVVSPRTATGELRKPPSAKWTSPAWIEISTWDTKQIISTTWIYYVSAEMYFNHKIRRFCSHTVLSLWRVQVSKTEEKRTVGKPTGAI